MRFRHRHLISAPEVFPDLYVLAIETTRDTRIRTPHDFADNQTRQQALRGQSCHR